ncbi:MAG: hypothetical protein HKN27_09150 [Silicimonas sp.]|nr:hypothetical protein [Silicimonas sp.]
MHRRAALQTDPRGRTYKGDITELERWDGFSPNAGDVILATPAKSGTTWAQSMIAMLLQGTCDLPDKLGVVSPWIDANFQPASETRAQLSQQTGRRVIKTHTPLDGWPVWSDVHLVVVFRHPLEVFLSSRKHLTNMRQVTSHPMLEGLDTALAYFFDTDFSEDEVDRDTLATIIRHFEAATSDRWPDKLMLNYASMSRDHAGTLAAPDEHLETGAAPELLAQVQRATEFSTMKSRASEFAPEAANEVWHKNEAFFAGGRSGAAEAAFSDTQLARYKARFAELLPDVRHRRWIETGLGHV